MAEAEVDTLTTYSEEDNKWSEVHTEGDPPGKVTTMHSAGRLAVESGSFVLINGVSEPDSRGLFTLALSTFQWTRIEVTGIPSLLYPSAVVARNRLFLVSGQYEAYKADGEKAGCWEFDVAEGKAGASAPKRLITYPPLGRDELEDASGEKGDGLDSADACYLAEMNKIFVLGGVTAGLYNGDNQYVCEIDIGSVSI